jgi:hypothetical protein
MPLTYTGRLVRPGGSEHPSLIDIAVALSRQPRFAGHCRRWWSVLDHTLFCSLLARYAMKQPLPSRELELAVMLHDAHEAITADVPTDVKTPALRVQQDLLDADIYDTYFSDGYPSYITDWLPEVKRIDRRALVAEAHVLGPPVESGRIVELFGSTDEQANDMELLRGQLRGVTYLANPPLSGNQEPHPAVIEFVKRMTELL